MLHSTLIDITNEAEQLFNVDKWSIEGIHVWPIIRLSLIKEIFYANQTQKQEKNTFLEHLKKERKSISIVKSTINCTYASLRDRSHNVPADRKADALLLSNGTSYSYIDGKWYDNFCDPMVFNLQNQGISSIVAVPKCRYLIPRYSPSIFIQPYLDLALLKNYLKNAFYHKKAAIISRDLEKEFSDFISFVKSKNLQGSTPSLKKITKITNQIKQIAYFFKSLLQSKESSIGLCVCYYSSVAMAFNLACYQLGIPSMDIQHGIQGDFHLAYSRWNKVPKQGYELLPSLFWVWSDYEASVIEKWNQPVSDWHQPIVGTNLLLKIWQENQQEFVKSYQNKVIKIQKVCSNNIHILYTLGIETVEDIKILFQIVERTQDKCHWWIRLHPTRLNQKQFIQKIWNSDRISNYEIDTASELPLYAILPHVQLHITQQSSAVIEAQKFGVPSILTSERGQQLFRDQITSGWALSAYTLEDIEQSIDIQLKKYYANCTDSELTKHTSANEGINILSEMILKSKLHKKYADT